MNTKSIYYFVGNVLKPHGLIGDFAYKIGSGIAIAVVASYMCCALPGNAAPVQWGIALDGNATMQNSEFMYLMQIYNEGDSSVDFMSDILITTINGQPLNLSNVLVDDRPVTVAPTSNGGCMITNYNDDNSKVIIAPGDRYKLEIRAPSDLGPLNVNAINDLNASFNSITIVPEPGAFQLLVAGISFFAFRRRMCP